MATKKRSKHVPSDEAKAVAKFLRGLSKLDRHALNDCYDGEMDWSDLDVIVMDRLAKDIEKGRHLRPLTPIDS